MKSLFFAECELKIKKDEFAMAVIRTCCEASKDIKPVFLRKPDQTIVIKCQFKSEKEMNEVIWAVKTKYADFVTWRK